MKTSRKSSAEFWLIASLVLVSGGVLLAVYLPSIVKAKFKITDNLLQRAQASQVQKDQYAYLRAALVIGAGDYRPIEALAQWFRDQGEYRQSLNLYAQAIPSPNPTYLGNLALRLQQYGLAAAEYSQAARDNRNAQSLAGLAIVSLNQDKIDEGCHQAAEARKLDLSNALANNLLAVCEVLKSSTNPSRVGAYMLLNASVYKKGEEWLQRSNPKSPSDWLSLSKLAAARGDITKAIEYASTGAGQAPGDRALNQVLANYYNYLGNSAKAGEYSAKYQDLLFSNYQ